ncbi:DNA topoisomerase III [Cetobacterium sp. 2A]|uniref:DNA topoisomerase n=1 Tax=Cetobacterium sp. 2A TaxID=2754723 RepID=UPI00163D24CB|nr:DNA topoisomerase [Cetobacterium sp. 2A]MBC2857033.1 DNA topoisomerase III [Cetobacterium sp. 2A]
MKLIIAEKPDLARAISEALPGEKKSRGKYIEQGEYIITWAIGHILKLMYPEEIFPKIYIEKQWKLDQLPINIENWEDKLKPIESTKEQLNVIKELLKKCSSIIHAGDPDPEGQLLIDEILYYFKNEKPVERVLINDNNKENILKAFEKIEDNKNYESLYKSARARSVADLMIGINYSRYFSLKSCSRLALGRVQTPTLGMIVNRDLSIESHEKRKYYDYYLNLGAIKSSNKSEKIELEKLYSLYQNEFIDETKKSEYQRKLLDEMCNLREDVPLRLKYTLSQDDNEEKYNKEFYEELKKYSKGKSFDIEIKKEKIIEKAPLPFNLNELQIYCNKKWGYSPSDTLAITQKLRDEYKAITYNRSDSQYLSIEHYNESDLVMDIVLKNLDIIIPELNTKKFPISECFNDEFVTAHHAIIPTKAKVTISELGDKERNVYRAICDYYIIQFLPNCIKEKTEAYTTLVLENDLKLTSTRIIISGFKNYLNDKLDSDNEETLSDLSKLVSGIYTSNFISDLIEEKETKPLTRYTEASLLKDMTSISKYVSDPEIKKLLKEKDKGKKGESGGIGTSATRANIIEKLLDLEFIEKTGKNIVSTQKGRDLIRISPVDLKNPTLTAKWWTIQEDIINGNKTKDDLYNSVIENFIKFKNSNPEIPILTSNNKTEKEIIGKCPKCGGNIYEGLTKEKKKNYYCGNYKEGCKFKMYEEMSHFKDKIKLSKSKVKNLLLNKVVAFKLTGKESETNLKLKLNGDYVNFEEIKSV